MDEEYPFDDGDDKPTAQVLRNVTVLDCQAGHLNTPKTGEPIGIVTLGFMGEVEAPLMLRMKDVQRLAVDLLGVAAHHGDKTAQEIMLKYFMDEDQQRCDGQATFVSPEIESIPASEAASSASTPDLPVTGLKLRVSFRDRSLRPLLMDVIGGYKIGRVVMVMYRCHDLGEKAEGVARLGPGFTIRFKPASRSKCLPRASWHDFHRLRHGSSVRVGQFTGTKMTLDQLKGLIHRKSFVST
jgi:hypothetical protein